jgi:hypothetical protein
MSIDHCCSLHGHCGISCDEARCIDGDANIPTTKLECFFHCDPDQSEKVIENQTFFLRRQFLHFLGPWY